MEKTMKKNRIIMASCLFLIGLAHAQDKAIDCKDQVKFNLCNINEKVGLKSISPVGNVQVEVKTTSPVGPGQVAGAQMQDGSVSSALQAQQKQVALIDAVKNAPTSVEPVDKYTDGKIDRKIFSCAEMAPIRYWAKNPDNPPNKEVRNDQGFLRGKTDAYGWYEVPMSYTNGDGTVVEGFGGAVGWRQPIYKNGVFDHWSGWPKASPVEMDRADWGWNFSSIGFCENKTY